MSQSRLAPPRSREVISRQLRTILRDSGQTAYALGRDSGISPRVIERFLAEERDIKLETLDRLADVLGLRLVETGRAKKTARPARREPPRDPSRTPRPVGNRDRDRDEPCTDEPEEPDDDSR